MKYAIVKMRGAVEVEVVAFHTTDDDRLVTRRVQLMNRHRSDHQTHFNLREALTDEGFVGGDHT